MNLKKMGLMAAAVFALATSVSVSSQGFSCDECYVELRECIASGTPGRTCRAIFNACKRSCTP